MSNFQNGCIYYVVANRADHDTPIEHHLLGISATYINYLQPGAVAAYLCGKTVAVVEIFHIILVSHASSTQSDNI